MYENLVLGIDISKGDGIYIPSLNPPIKVNFVIQKLSYVGSDTNKLVTDSKMMENLASVLGFSVKGAYHYVGSKVAWRAQADYFIDLMAGKYDFWAWDVENKGNSYSADFIRGVVPALEYIYTQTKKPGLLYLNPDIWGTWYKYAEIQEDIVRTITRSDMKIGLWVAYYKDIRRPDEDPEYWKVNNGSANMPRNWKFWQYDDKGMGNRGKEFGVQSYGLDLNVFNGTMTQLVEWAKPLVVTPPPIEPPVIIIPPVEQPEGGYMNVLNVKYVSQIMSGALEHNNDCASASALMLLKTYNLANTITVDQFYNSICPSGDVALSAGSIQTKMASYGLKTDWFVNTTVDAVYSYLRNHKPILALIHYAPLVTAGVTEKKSFLGAHFLLITGIDLDFVYVNDPYRDDGKINIAVPIFVFEQAWKCGVDGNPDGGCVVPKLKIQDLSVPDVFIGEEYYLVVNGLNLRSGPGSNYPLVRTIWKSTEPVISVKAETLSNGYVAMSNGTGYVWFEYLRKK